MGVPPEDFISMATSSGSSAAKRRKLSSNGPSLICSFRDCTLNGIISCKAQSRLEIKAATNDTPNLQEQTVVRWGPTGEAVFHEECWKMLLKAANQRKSKNSSLKMSRVEQGLIREAAKTVERHDSRISLETASSKIAALMKNAKHCVVFTGAGISTSAGIGDYRGKEGKWTEMDRAQSAAGKTAETTEAETSEEDGVEYEELRPTYTHEALVKLMELGVVKYIISQNGDGLHSLSGIEHDSLAELHGNVFLEVCEKCDKHYYRSYYVLDDTASQYYEDLQDNGQTDIQKPKHAVRCERCGLNHRTGRRCDLKDCKGHLKDSIINFGDHLEEEILRKAEDQAREADLILSLGTTMQVTPACDLVLMGKEPLRLVIVNRQKTGFDEACYRRVAGGNSGEEELGVRVFGDCDDVMREVMSHLLKTRELRVWEGLRDARMEKYQELRTTKEC